MEKSEERLLAIVDRVEAEIQKFGLERALHQLARKKPLMKQEHQWKRKIKWQ